MNNDTVAGKFDQVKGKVKQSVGEAVGNQRMANSGAADQVKGAAKEAWGDTKDAARAVGTDARMRADEQKMSAKAGTRETGHTVRDTITHAAQNVKNAVKEHADKVKHEHPRH